MNARRPFGLLIAELSIKQHRDRGEKPCAFCCARYNELIRQYRQAA